MQPASKASDHANSQDVYVSIGRPNAFKKSKTVVDDDAEDCRQNCVVWSLTLCSSLMLIGLVACYITWIVFAIKSIIRVSNKDITQVCPKSSLWYCMLAVLCSQGFGMIISSNRSNNDDRKFDKLVSATNIIISLIMLVWSAIELFHPCAVHNLNNNRVYKLLEIWFYFGCVSFIFICLVYSCYICCYRALNRD